MYNYTYKISAGRDNPMQIAQCALPEKLKEGGDRE